MSIFLIFVGEQITENLMSQHTVSFKALTEILLDTDSSSGLSFS